MKPFEEIGNARNSNSSDPKGTYIFFSETWKGLVVMEVHKNAVK